MPVQPQAPLAPIDAFSGHHCHHRERALRSRVQEALPPHTFNCAAAVSLNEVTPLSSLIVARPKLVAPPGVCAAPRERVDAESVASNVGVPGVRAG